MGINPVLQTGLLNQSSAQVIDGSLNFEGGKNQALKRTPGSDGNRKTWTWSAWVKKHKDSRSTLFSAGATSSDTGFAAIEIESDEQLRYSGWNTLWKESTEVFRDYNQFYHIVVAFDVTQATASNRVRLYKNGVEITNLATNNSLSNTDYPINDNVIHYIGGIDGGGGENITFNDYNMTQVYLIDGQALGPGYFGFTDPLTNTWRPKKFRAVGTTVNDGTQWSSYMSNASGAGNLFDGSTTTAYGPDGNTQTFTPPKPIVVKNSLRIYYSSGSTSRNFEVNDNGNVVATGTGTKWVDLNFTGPLTKISGSNGWNVYAIEVDGVIMKDSTTTNLDFGTNGFYLPMDGNSPIGQDKSGKGNNWTPVNFGGSTNSLDKATGALPILNTVSGGNYATPSTRTDSNASSVIFAAPLIDGAIDVSNQINSGSTTKSGTLSGATSESVSNFYGKSLVFDGSNDSISYTNQSEFVMGTSDFTMECWVYVHGTGSERTVFGLKHTGGSGWTGYKFYLNTSAAFIFYAEDAGSGGWDVGLSAGNNTINVNRWQHLAVTRSGNTFRIFVDGVLKNSTTSSVDLNDTGSGFYIGQNGYDQQWMDGNIQDVRIYKGVAKYTSDFVPASTNPDILPDTPSGVSGSSKLTKITDGAVSFDGTGDYLSVPDSDDFDLAGNDWTVEAFVYHSSADYASYEGIVGQWVDNSGTARTWILETVGSGATSDLEFYYYDTSNNFVGPVQGGTLSKNRWHHVAACRSGNTIRMFIDGVMYGTGTSISVNIKNATNNLTIGGNVAGAGYWNGFISNVRVINNTALYTANFTPPSAPLTNITNTKLLCCQSNTSATEGAVKPGTITANGDSTANTFSPFNTDINTVRGQETGYATLNPLQMSPNSTPTMSNGNLSLSRSAGSSEWTNTGCTMTIPKSGKWFWELTWTSVGGGSVARAGVADSNDYEFNRNTSGTGLPWLGSGTGTSWSCDVRGYKYNGGTETTGYLSAFAAGDVMGILLDRDNNTITYTRNGVSGGVAHSNVTPDFVTPGFSLHAGTTNSFDVNFGQKPFKFPPPDGFQPLNAINLLPERVFARSDKYFANSTWSGNGVSGRLINIGMQPDMVWYKMTNNNVQHELYDSVRGANKGLLIGKNTQQFTYSNRLLSFVYNGFTVGDAEQVNENSTKDYVGWSWKAGGNKGTFNVDDVGYANASDVNMSVGSLNTAAYDDSIVWSSNYTGTAQPTQAFDGTGPKQNGYAHQSGGLTITFPGAGLSGRIIVYGGTGGGGADTYTLSDGSSLSSAVQYDTSPYYEALDFGVKSSITSLVCSPGYTLYGIRVDGKLLVDNGVTPPNAPSIAPSGCSVGTKQGFSIIKYTGSGSNGTIPHGLSQEPDFFFGRDLEDTSASRDWIVYHKIMGNTGRLKLVGNASISESSAFFNTSGPTNNLISVGTSNDINSTNDYMMYCWHDVPGLQKFGGYVGNGDDNGPFIETGFRPALVWTRAYSANSNNNSHWLIYDSRINTYNESSQVLYINLENGVNTHASMGIDILSNGFKLKADSAGYSNYSGWSYIYCAWAEAPAFNLYGAQSNAR